MRIFAFHDESGCGFYRVKLPLGELAANGHDVTLRLGSDVKPSELADYPLVVGQRMDKHGALPHWRRARATSKLVYEIDDDVFNVDVTNWMAYGTFSRADTQDAVAHAAEVADLVTVTTESLAAVMRRHNDNVAVLPNCVPGELLEWERPRRDEVTVGWAGGASHGMDIGMVAQPIRRFLDRTPKAKLHLVGTDYRDTIQRAGRVRFTSWDPDPRGYYRNLDFDIGLAPLTDTVFNRSKSPIKTLEYAAVGIPVVASDVGPYSEFVVDGVTGFLCRRPGEWSRRLDELANDQALREEMGRKAREHAAQFTIQRNWHRWAQAYEGLL